MTLYWGNNVTQSTFSPYNINYAAKEQLQKRGKGLWWGFAGK
jgi:hypothetical protein